MNKEKKQLIPELRFPEFNENWKLGDIEDLTNTVMGNAFKSKDFVTEGIQLVRMGNLYAGKLQLDRSPKFLPQDFRDKYEKYLLKPFDILMSMTGTVGKKDYGYVIQIPEKSPDLLLNQRVVKLIPKENCIQDFLLQLLKSECFLSVLYSLPGGTKQANLSIGQLKGIEIFYPKNKEEQQKIANCLSSLDNLITAETDKLENLKDHKKGLLQQLFPAKGETKPKYRFPEFKNDGDWEVRSIEKNLDMISGIALKSEELTEDKSGIPILRGINITEGRIRHSQEMDKFYLGDTSKINKYLVKENDIVIGMDGSKVGKNVSLISKCDVGSILIQRVARIRAIDSDIKYLYQNFISQRFITYVDNVNTSSGIPHISAKQIRDYEIGFPPNLKEQQKISNCLSSVDDLIETQTIKIEALKGHRKGLMQQLFPSVNELSI